MRSLVKEILPRLLASLALSSVLYVWVTLFEGVAQGQREHSLAFNLLLTASVIAVFTRYPLSRWEGKKTRAAIVLLALLNACLLPGLVGLPLMEFSLLAVFLFVISILAANIGRADWGYIDARSFMRITSIFLGIGLVASSFLRLSFQMPYVMVYVFSMFICLILSRDLHVDAHVRADNGNNGFVGLITVSLLVVLILFVSKGGLFGIVPLLSFIGNIVREVILVLLWPLGFVVQGLVTLLRHFMKASDGQELPFERPNGPAEELSKVTKDLSGVYDPAIGFIVIAIVLVVAYLWLRPARVRSAKTHVEEERESLLGEALNSGLRLRLPRLRKVSTLPKVPSNIWQAFAWLEYWGTEKKRARRRGETVSEYASTLHGALSDTEVDHISTSFEAARYGERVLTEEQWQQVLNSWRKLKEQFDNKG